MHRRSSEPSRASSTPHRPIPTATHRCQLAGHSDDDDLLVAVLDEVIYLLDTENEAPIDVELEPIDAGIDVRFAVCEATKTAPDRRRPQGGVAARACASLVDQDGWRCSVTLVRVKGRTRERTARRFPFAGIVRIR